MLRFALALFAVLLSGCQAARYAGDETSPYYAPPAGSRLALNRELTIPPDEVGAYLQNGEVVSFREIRTYYPHCKLELRRRLGSPQVVKPGEFEITRVVREESPFVSAARVLAGRPAAGIGVTISAGGGQGDGGPSQQAFATRLYLRSSAQPDVYRLSCGQWGYPEPNTLLQHVSIADMRKALGEVMALRIARPAGERR